jgi:hypothetical protein
MCILIFGSCAIKENWNALFTKIFFLITLKMIFIDFYWVHDNSETNETCSNILGFLADETCFVRHSHRKFQVKSIDCKNTWYNTSSDQSTGKKLCVSWKCQQAFFSNNENGNYSRLIHIHKPLYASKHQITRLGLRAIVAGEKTKWALSQIQSYHFRSMKCKLN